MDTFSEEQKLAYEKYLNGESIFISGEAGTGKSHLIKNIYSHALKNNKNIKVCSLTGCSAILLGCKATTLHSFAGIGLADKPNIEIVNYLFNNKHKLVNWKKLNILIIDEVSMMSLKIFLLLDMIARKYYNKHLIPFGGLQIIFTGDFYQLSPVSKNNENDESSMYCFQHTLWNELFKKENHIILKNVFRQKDEKFLKILKYVRKGKITKTVKVLLENRVFTNEELNKIKNEKLLTILSPLKREVDKINKNYYFNLKNDTIKSYKIKCILNNTKSNSEIIELDEFDSRFKNNIYLYNDYYNLINNINIEKNIELKIGTQVMCIYNMLSLNIANGSQGIVVSFSSNDMPIVKFNDIEEPIEIKMNIWELELNRLIAIQQIPLIYGWAITIHKSQGLTLENAIIDIGSNIFIEGQTYVAISRVKSLEGLYLSNFDYKKISANKEVENFYNNI